MRAWTNLSRRGFPLIERIPRDSENRLVTFVWRPGGRVRSPSIYTPIANFQEKETELRPLGESGVWYRSFVLYRKTRASYGFSRRPLPSMSDSDKAWTDYMRTIEPDPFNPDQVHFPKNPHDPNDIEQALSVASLPNAPRQPWGRVRGDAFWKEDCHPFRSRHLRNTRDVWVYLPPEFRAGRRRFNLLIVLDGEVYRDAVPVPRIVQNLVTAGRISPTVVVAVGTAPHARSKDLFRNRAFDDFLARELLPWIRRRYRWSAEPSRTVLAGSSLGGLESAQAALHYPRLFGNVLAQSGAFQAFQFRGKKAPPSLMREFARAPLVPVRFYLDAGTHEVMAIPNTASTLLGSVRHMRDVLEAKGYPVAYAEFEGGHDYACWRGTFADGLLLLLGQS